MPKMKTHSGASKRIRSTGGGKFKRNCAYGSHILTKKSSKRKRNLRQSKMIGSQLIKAVRDMLPYG